MGWIAAVVFDGVISRLGPLALSGAIHTVLVLTVIAGFQALGPRTVLPRVAWMTLEPPTAVAPDLDSRKHRPSTPRPVRTSRAPELRPRDRASPLPGPDGKSSASTSLPAGPMLPSAPAQPSPAQPSIVASPPPEASSADPPAPMADSETSDAAMAVPRHVVRHEGAGQDVSSASGPGPAGWPRGTATAALPPSEPSGRMVVRPAEPRGGYQVRPPYPPAARRRGIQGRTLLRVHIETDGRVGDIVVQESTGHAELDRAAVDAVRQWRFEPARNEAGPVAMWVLIPVEFRLTDGR